MDMRALPFGEDTPRRTHGVNESALDKQLAAWARAGHLTGDEHAATRRAMRSAAMAADYALAQVATGEASPYSLAMVVRTLHDILATHAPSSAGTDALDDALAELMAAAPGD